MADSRRLRLRALEVIPQDDLLVLVKHQSAEFFQSQIAVPLHRIGELDRLSFKGISVSFQKVDPEGRKRLWLCDFTCGLLVFDGFLVRCFLFGCHCLVVLFVASVLGVRVAAPNDWITDKSVGLR